MIGLGAMGSATLYQLASRGLDVVGIDQFDPPHVFGSSHGESRVTRTLTMEGVEYAPMASRSHQLWREIEAATGEDILTANGILHVADLAAMPGSFDNHERAAAELDVEYERLESADLALRYPQFRFGPDDVALHEPGGGLVRPENAIRAQLTLAAAAGADIHTRERVVAIEPGAAGVSVRTDRALYRCDQVVVAAGAGLPGLLDESLASLFQVYRQVLHWFEVPAGSHDYGPDAFPTFIWRHGAQRYEGFYGFPSLDGRTIKLATGQFEVASDPDRLDRKVSPSEQAAFYRTHLGARLPAVSPGVSRSVVCMYTVTPDMGFVLDRHPRHERVFIASPCSGHGFKHSAAIGEAVAEILATGTSTIDVSPFGLARFVA